MKSGSAAVLLTAFLFGVEASSSFLVSKPLATLQFDQEKQLNYALGFRGEYIRHSCRQTENCHSSDFFLSYPNIKQNVIDPLRKIGNVNIYFDTVSTNESCTLDDALLNILQPKKYHFRTRKDKKHTNYVNSVTSVLDLIQQDADHQNDYVILLRFDVQYNKPIDALDIRWDVTNVAFKGNARPYDVLYTKVSDLFFISPKAHLKALRSSLVDAGGNSMERMALPFAKRMGVDNLNAIDKDYIGSSRLDTKETKTATFLFISRDIGRPTLQCVPAMLEAEIPRTHIVPNLAVDCMMSAVSIYNTVGKASVSQCVLGSSV